MCSPKPQTHSAEIAVPLTWLVFSSLRSLAKMKCCWCHSHIRLKLSRTLIAEYGKMHQCFMGEKRMPRRNKRSTGEKMPLGSNISESALAKEIAFREVRKNLIKAEPTFYESKPVQQVGSKLSAREEDCSSPWYFCHT